jgi:RNA 2',3'-cyclic 3'-phosphodiesterase
MIRAFIALTLPMDLCHLIQGVSAALQKLQLPLRWIKSTDAHLTLKFLGDVPENELTAVGQALERALVGQAPFTVHVQSLGCFPSPSRPRVVWMGIDDPGQRLFRLHQQLETELTPLGFAPETRPFRPHITLARALHGRNPGQLAPLLQAYQDRRFGDIVVTQLHLFQSHLYRKGAMYTILHSVALQN